MQSNSKKPDPVRLGPSSGRSGSDTKQVRRVQTRRPPYRVGYNWNKGGRLKELRIRHLARKFLKIWIQNSFGRILPHKAKFHYNTVVLRRAFEGWRDEWWVSRREWSLVMRAECHYRYYLCNLAFHSWRVFMSRQKEKKRKAQHAQSFADMQRMRQVWDRWEVFTEVRRIKNKMLESALEQNRLAALNSAWSLWRTSLQQRQDIHALEEQALKQRGMALQRKTWLRWKDMHKAACCQKEKESKAVLHFSLRLKRKTLHRWKSYVSRCQSKERSQAVASRARSLYLVALCWSKWTQALRHKQSEDDRLKAARHLAVQSTKRRALEGWRSYVMLCREEAERNRIASEHHHHHLLRVGLRGLSLDVLHNKTHRLNKNIAVQHCHQTMTYKYWQLWKERLEEAEDRHFQSLREMAVANHRTSLLSSYFHTWREKFAEQRHMQELENRADVWFAERMLPQCLNSWITFTQQGRLHKHMRHKADVYNRQRQLTRVFYTWWGRLEQHKEQALSERMAILHEEQCQLHRAWICWRQRMEQRVDEKEKQKASEQLYLHRLLHKTMAKWRENSSEIRDMRNLEQQACHHGDLRLMRWTVETWRRFTQSQRKKKSRLKKMQRFHEIKQLKQTFMAWKTHHVQMTQVCGHADELYRQQQHKFLRKELCVWRENTMLLAELRLQEHRADDHFWHVLCLKVFLAWREVTTHAVSKRRQQGEAVCRAQRSINEVRLLRSFRQWRNQTREARRERICMEKARKHHESKLLCKALTAWDKHHHQYKKKKVMKRQEILLLRLKMYQKYFELWRVKLQHRHREAEQTERALWHWSLSLQAKVLYAWRLWVFEQRRQQEQAVRAAQTYRDHLLREGVTRILTYAAHMNDLTTSLTQYSQEQRSRHLHRVVKRCAMRWKQRALLKPQKEEVKEQPQKKRVTFCVSRPKSVSSSDSVEQEAEDGVLSELLLSLKPRRQPRRLTEQFETQFETNTLKLSAVTGTERQEVSHVLRSESHLSSVDCPHENHDVLLPPSAFITTGAGEALAWTNGSISAPINSSSYPDDCLRETSAETVREPARNPTSDLTRELLSIQEDMKMYQKDRKQLRAWQKLKEVLQSWLQTSGKDEQMGIDAVRLELEELDERISRLSSELGKRKPMMILHAERIQHLKTALQASGVYSLLPKTDNMEKDYPTLTQ